MAASLTRSTPLRSRLNAPAGRRHRPSPTPRRAGWSFVKPSVIPGFGLTLGYTLTYLSLIVLIPLIALFLKAATTAARPDHRDRHVAAHAHRTAK